jgi:hypothetical protein
MGTRASRVAIKPNDQGSAQLSMPSRPIQAWEWRVGCGVMCNVGCRVR